MVMVEEKQAIVFVRDEISELILLVATDKGAFLYYSDGDRRHWDVNGPHFLGSVIHHLVLDPRDNKTLLASVHSRLSGSTVFRSNDFGKTWESARKPPEFQNDKLKRRVDQQVCQVGAHIDATDKISSCELPHVRIVGGVHQVNWDGKNGAGADAASGVYLLRLETAYGDIVRKVSLLR